MITQNSKGKQLVMTPKTWDAAVHHPLQSWAWGEFRKSMGVSLERYQTKKNNTTEYWQLTFHRIPYTSYTIGYFPKGPHPTAEMINTLIETGSKHKAIYIQIEPNVITNNQTRITDNQLIPSHHPLFTKYTFVLDLTKSESELLAGMHPKTRYNIKVAQKHHVTVKEDNSKKAFEAYIKLSAETTNRQGFYAHNELYQRKMWEIMYPAGIARLWTASVNDEIVATWILFLWEDTLYYPYGASSRNHREAMAPTLLLWEIIKWAKSQQFKYFDLWGAMGPNPDPNNPWYGFHRFKEGFHPDLIEFMDAQDLVIQPILYKAYTLLDHIRWTYLKLIKK